MKSLHDVAARQSLEARIDRLRPDSVRQWGTMRVDQMLRHVNSALEMTLGRLETKPKKVPLPRPLLKLLVLLLPWPKGKAPTAAELIAADTYDFEVERERLRRLVKEVASRSLDGVWLTHPAFGPLTGLECTRLQSKHIDHHLRQFGV